MEVEDGGWNGIGNGGINGGIKPIGGGIKPTHTCMPHNIFYHLMSLFNPFKNSKRLQN